MKNSTRQLCDYCCTTLLAISLAFTGMLPLTVSAELPDIGDAASQVITPDEEYRMGKQLLKEVRKSLPLTKDIELNIYINKLGYDLVSKSQDIEFPFTFILVDDDAINAFAMPGGIIGINRGLIEIAQTESELAAVLAHEIAHVTQRHLARLYQETKGNTLKTALGILAAVIIGSYSSQGGQAALMGSLAMTADSQLRFSRANETDADRVGQRILDQSGYDTNAIATIFDRMQTASLSDPDSVTEFLQTHPLPASRITDSLRLKKLDQSGRKQDSLNYRIARARMTGISSSLTVLNSLARSLDPSKPEDQYLAAIILLRNNQVEEARAVLQRIKLDPGNQLAIQLQEVRTMVAAKDYATAQETISALHKDHPRNPVVVKLQAEVYLLRNEAKSALKLLKETRVSMEQWPELLLVKADAAQKSGYAGQSHEALAEYYYYQGDIARTLHQVKLGLKSPSISSIMRKRLEQNKKDLEEAKKNMKVKETDSESN